MVTTKNHRKYMFWGEFLPGWTKMVGSRLSVVGLQYSTFLTKHLRSLQTNKNQDVGPTVCLIEGYLKQEEEII